MCHLSTYEYFPERSAHSAAHKKGNNFNTQARYPFVVRTGFFFCCAPPLVNASLHLEVHCIISRDAKLAIRCLPGCLLLQPHSKRRGTKQHRAGHSCPSSYERCPVGRSVLSKTSGAVRYFLAQICVSWSRAVLGSPRSLFQRV